MLKLRQIMTTDLLTLSAETSVREAMELLGRYHVSGAPVVNGSGKLLGVVTTTDIMTFVSGLSGVPTERNARDWSETRNSLLDQDVGDDEDEQAVAYFSDLWQDADVDASTRMASTAGPEWNMLEEHDVSELMTSTPLTTLGPDADASKAAELMSSLGIHRVLVTDGDVLVGIVSALDIAKAAAEGKLTTHRYVFNHDGDFRRE